MTPGVLVDAGPLVAILHRDDKDHQPCVEALQRLREPLLTTWMPVTEAMYLLEFSTPAQSALLVQISSERMQRRSSVGPVISHSVSTPSHAQVRSHDAPPVQSAAVSQTIWSLLQRLTTFRVIDAPSTMSRAALSMSAV